MRGLQELERGAAGLIERDDFAIEHGAFAGELLDSAGDLGESGGEFVVKPRVKVDAALVLDGQSTDTVELDFVNPVAANRRVSHETGLHGFDEIEFAFGQTTEIA